MPALHHRVRGCCHGLRAPPHALPAEGHSLFFLLTPVQRRRERQAAKGAPAGIEEQVAGAYLMLWWKPRWEEEEDASRWWKPRREEGRHQVIGPRSQALPRGKPARVIGGTKVASR